MTKLRSAVACAVVLLVSACSRSRTRDDPDAAIAPARDAESAFVWPLSDDASRPEPRRGMIWIPSGVLVAGTPEGRTPRVADEELPGVATPLHGFYIDEFAYPNEAGAIPKTGLSRDEAQNLCVQQGKRLCSELEWERACKGPSNWTYDYGDAYRAAECTMGVASRLSPSGLRVGCKSGFGVHDLHGGPWEWTASAWGRGGSAQLGTVRGGNAEAGELVGRCANGMALAPATKRGDLGVRCCSGEANNAEVQLPVTRGKLLEVRAPKPASLAALSDVVMANAPHELPKDQAFRVDRIWSWHPVGNEELLIAAGCAKVTGHLACGVGVFREHAPPGEERAGDAPTLIAFVSSGWWMAVVRSEPRGRDLWVYGGDDRSSFRTRIAYAWGRVALGEPERPPAHGERQ